MRKTCLDSVYELAKSHSNLFFIGSDIGAGTLDLFKRDFPDRFFVEGISEAHVVGMAAGLALSGKSVYVNTIANFLTRRSFEQICLDVCLHKLPVRFLGNGGGLVYAPLGPTHMATDDFSLMRALPNMTILAPADAYEMKCLMMQTMDHPGPIYVRIAKGGDKIVTNQVSENVIGDLRQYYEGTDVLLLSTGIMLQNVLVAREMLEAGGISVAVLHAATIKPFDEAAFLNIAAPFKVILTVEEHSKNGGLGTIVAEILSEKWRGPQKLFSRMGIPDMFPDDYGSQEHLIKRYSLSPEDISRMAKSYLG